jgi:hypothetical protein
VSLFSKTYFLKTFEEKRRGSDRLAARRAPENNFRNKSGVSQVAADLRAAVPLGDPASPCPEVDGHLVFILLVERRPRRHVGLSSDFRIARAIPQYFSFSLKNQGRECSACYKY